LKFRGSFFLLSATNKQLLTALPMREAGSLEPTDRALMQRACHGDRGAFHQLVDRHAPGLYRLAVAMTHHTVDAHDLVQETLLVAFEQMHKFEHRSSVRTWLVGILVRQVANHRRQSARRRAGSLDEASGAGAAMA